ASLAGMLASKYFFFLTPIPLVFYLWVRRESRWRVPPRRWLQLIAVAVAFWVCLNWSPFLPSTWEYAKTYTTGQQTVHGSLFFISVLPAFLIFAGAAAAAFIERLRLPAPRWVTAAAAVLLLPGSEALAAIAHAPHYRTYISPLAGGDARVQWYFPHCDYFDAGFREAVGYVADHSEHGAELSTEIEWPAQLYVHAAGRRDLQLSLVRHGRACHSGNVCYVVVQVGRLYFVNEDAVANLSRRTPWHVEQIG